MRTSHDERALFDHYLRAHASGEPGRRWEAWCELVSEFMDWAAGEDIAAHAQLWQTAPYVIGRDEVLVRMETVVRKLNALVERPGAPSLAKLLEVARPRYLRASEQLAAVSEALFARVEVHALVCVEPDSCLVALGGQVHQLSERGCSTHPHIHAVARSPNRRRVALASDEWIAVHRGWGGPLMHILDYPTGHEDVPPEDQPEVPRWEVAKYLRNIALSNDGLGAVLDGTGGVFWLRADEPVTRLSDVEQLFEWLEWYGHPGRDDEQGWLSPDGAVALCLEEERCTTYRPRSPGLLWSTDGLTPRLFPSTDGRLCLAAGVRGLGERRSIPREDPGPDRLWLVPSEELDTPGWPHARALDFELHELHDTLQTAVADAHGWLLACTSGRLIALDHGGALRWEATLDHTPRLLEPTPDGALLYTFASEGCVSLLELDATARLRARWWFANGRQPLRWI